MCSFLLEICLKIFIDTGIRHSIFANNTQTLACKSEIVSLYYYYFYIRSVLLQYLRVILNDIVNAYVVSYNCRKYSVYNAQPAF